MMPSTRTVIGTALAVALLCPAGVGLASETTDTTGTSGAAADGDCDKLFPDFTCEGREARYEGFTPPSSMPYYFEDPFITSGAYAHLIYHAFPWDSAFRGGYAFVAALQLRLAITDRLAFIATKDGYTWMRPGDHSVIDDEVGFYDIMAGFKYALIDRPEDRFILTPALRLDIPVGNDDVLAGNPPAVIVPSMSSGLGLGPVNFIASVGGRIPFNNRKSTSVFYNLRVDTPILDCFVPFVELNGTTWTKSGNGKRNIHTKLDPPNDRLDLSVAQEVLHGAGVTDTRSFEGADVVNLGSERVAGKTLLTLALGGRVPLGDRTSVGAYYELPISKRDDIFKERISIDLAFDF